MRRCVFEGRERQNARPMLVLTALTATAGCRGVSEDILWLVDDPCTQGACSTETVGSNTGDDCSDAVWDTFLSDANPGANYGGESVLQLDGDDATLGFTVALLRFDLCEIPAGSVVVDATLVLTVPGNPSIDTFELYAVGEAWSEGTGTGTTGVANWNARRDESGTPVPWTGAGCTAGSRAVDLAGTWEAPVDQVNEIPIEASVVQEWLSHPQDNWGLVLTPALGASNGTKAVASESDNDGERPRLRVTFLLP